MSLIGENVKKMRLKLGISQNKLAKSAGISQAALSGIESNVKNPSSVTVELLANALGCTTAELLGEADADESYTAAERDLIAAYRSLNAKGKEYVRQQLAIARQLYAGESVSSAGLETKIAASGGNGR